MTRRTPPEVEELLEAFRAALPDIDSTSDGSTKLGSNAVLTRLRHHLEQRCFNDYASVTVDGGVQVQLGDVYSGQQLRLVLRLHIPKLPLLGATKVAEVVLQYVTIGDRISTHTQTLPVVVNAVSAEEAAGVAGDQDVADEVVVLSAAKATAEARELVAEGRRELAAELLRSAITDLRGAEQRSSFDTDLGSRAAALERTVNEMVADTFDAASRKRLHYQAKDLQRSRHRARRELEDE